MNKLYVCFGDTKKQKQTNKLYTSGCLTEKKIRSIQKSKKNNWVLSCIIYLWMKNKQKIQFATPIPKDY